MFFLLLIAISCSKKDNAKSQTKTEKITAEFTAEIARLKKLKQDTIDATNKYNAILVNLKHPIVMDEVIKELGLEGIYLMSKYPGTFNNKHAQYMYLKNGEDQTEIRINFIFFCEVKDGKIIKSEFVKAVATNEFKLENINMGIELLELNLSLNKNNPK